MVLYIWLVGTAVLGLWVTRRLILPRLHLKSEDAIFAAPLVQSAILLYSLIATLTAIGVWQKYSQVADIV